MYIFYIKHTRKSKVQNIVCKLLKQYKYLIYKEEKKMLIIFELKSGNLGLNVMLCYALVLMLLTEFVPNSTIRRSDFSTTFL